MQYIDWDQLESISVEEFEAATPYPFANRRGLLTDAGFERLLANMPELAIFDQRFGEQRLAGQQPHDRYSLEYKPDTPVPVPWQEFIAELCSDHYRQNIARLLRAPKIEFRFHWHYTPNGCSVSPHTDSSRERGSHLFYFNSEQDWRPEWGGETLALDDGGRLDYKTAPELSDFKGEIKFKSIGNYSAIMKRTDHAWHAVRPIHCPEDRLRRIFIVVVNPSSLFWRLRDRVIGKKKQAF